VASVKPNLRDVYVAGVGMTAFGKFKETPVEAMGQSAVRAALRDSGLTRQDIDAAYCGSVMQGLLVGQRILKDVGLSGVPVFNHENACSSGSSALSQAWLSVAAGLCDAVLVVGAEKLSGLGGGPLPIDTDDPEIEQGVTMPAIYAMRTRAYLEKYGGSVEQVAGVTVKNRRHAADNPYAQYRDPVTVDEVLGSRLIADPITLLQMCPNADGAAAAILCAEDGLKDAARAKVRILASVVTSGKFEQGYRDMTTPDISIRASTSAYEMAGCKPQDIDVVEVHDAAAIAEVLYYEALGLCSSGDGLAFLDSGATAIGGQVPVNPSGGLLCRGHPLGATGLAQVAELTWQLRGEAEDRQVAGARTALAHCTGGGIWGVDNGVCAVHILGV
jgi:acetyl-CoA acetyltransferase